MARIPLTQIQQEAEEQQWKLLSGEYKNLKSELTFECPKGHTVITSYEKWRRSHSCPICELAEKEKSNVDVIMAKGKNEYRILALDQATKTSGWAIFSNGELLRHGMFILEGGKEVDRINEIKKWVWNMVTVWNVDFVQMEDIQLQDHKEAGKESEKIGVTTYKALAHLQGVLENLLYSNGIEYNIVPSSTWRQYCEIKGRNKVDKKKNAQLKVQSLYNIFVPLDEAEAICIGRYAVNRQAKKNTILSWE